MKISEVTNIFEDVRWHGSRNNHAAFDTSHTGHNSHTFGHYNTTRYGIFFTDNEDFSKIYGEPKQYELTVKNTYSIELNDYLDSIMKDAGIDNNFRNNVFNGSVNLWELFDDYEGEMFVQELKNRGYDSAEYTEWLEDDDGIEHKSNTVVVFSPANVIKNNQPELDLWEELS